MAFQETVENPNRWPSQQPRVLVVALIFAYLLLVRLLPYIFYRLGMQLDPSVSYYPWNFSPAFAVCLFGGAVFRSRLMAIVLPLGTFLLSDLGVWALTGRVDWAFYPWQFAVYVSIAVCAVLGTILKNDRRLLRLAGTGLAGCTAFFVLTNLAVWGLSGTYPQTPTGLLECYIAALPYYRNSLLGTAFFSAILFSPLCLRAGDSEINHRSIHTLT